MDERIEVIKGVVTSQSVDALLNPTDSGFSKFVGNNSAIFENAGLSLSKKLKKLKKPAAGDIILTKGFDLKAKWIIHQIGPGEDDDQESREKTLRECYRNAFSCAVKREFRSIALNELGDTLYKIPRITKIIILVDELQKFLKSDTTIEKVYIVCSSVKGLNIFKLYLTIEPESSLFLTDLLTVQQKKNEHLSKSLERAIENEQNQKKEITDSIKYAQRIQKALFPSELLLESCFKEYMVLSKPRNIVSGDFYWVSRKDDDRVIVAAADCTGHGVPGAMLSMLGISFLNEIVNSNRIYNSGEILNSLRQRVVKTLQQTGNEDDVKDGLDIALCSINYDKHSLEFSGANNPMYLIRRKELVTDDLLPFLSDTAGILNEETNSDYSLFEIKGDKMPIAVEPHMEAFNKDMVKYKLKRKLYLTRLRDNYSFNTRSINFLPGDEVYIASDGYIDQFGGPYGKKFLSKQLRKLLLSVSEKSCAGKKKTLEETFNKWKGDHPQVDDVLIVGFRL